MPRNSDFPDYQKPKVENAGGWDARKYNQDFGEKKRPVPTTLPTFGRQHQEKVPFKKPEPKTRVTNLADLRLQQANTNDLKNRNIR